MVVEEEDTCQLPSGREVSEVDSGAIGGGREYQVRAKGRIERGEKREVRRRFLVPVIAVHLRRRRSPSLPVVATWHPERKRASKKETNKGELLVYPFQLSKLLISPLKHSNL